MSLEIIFLPKVSTAEKQTVLDFVSLWQNSDKFVSIYTSGSTGTPKKINVSKNVMVASAKATGQFFNFNSDNSILLNLSANYIAGMMQIVRASVYGMKLIVAPVCNNPLLFLNDEVVDFAAFVPLQVKNILDNEASREKYQNINSVIIGGAPINRDLFNDITSLENDSYATFGMTETVSHVALKKIKESNNYYKALPNISFGLTDQDCLIINAPAISENQIITNDRVELIDECSFKWLGRVDFVINSGGVKIQPEHVENKISELIPQPYYISKESDELLGERVVLLIEGNQFSEEKLTELQSSLNSALKKYEVPKVIKFKKRFKRTSSGKLIRE